MSDEIRSLPPIPDVCHRIEMPRIPEPFVGIKNCKNVLSVSTINGTKIGYINTELNIPIGNNQYHTFIHFLTISEPIMGGL